jgi:hypothetical protein
MQIEFTSFAERQLDPTYSPRCVSHTHTHPLPDPAALTFAALTFAAPPGLHLLASVGQVRVYVRARVCIYMRTHASRMISRAVMQAMKLKGVVCGNRLGVRLILREGQIKVIKQTCVRTPDTAWRQSPGARRPHRQHLHCLHYLHGVQTERRGLPGLAHNPLIRPYHNPTSSQATAVREGEGRLARLSKMCKVFAVPTMWGRNKYRYQRLPVESP